MSIVPKETIHVIAQSIGISNLHDDVAAALAPDVEYRMREIMQEAIKCMRHSKRSVLTTDDVNTALSLRNVEPLYGFASGDPLRFRRAVGHSDLFFIDDRELDCKEITEAPLTKAPLDTAVMAHWLAIEGIQPAIPENVPIDPLSAPPEVKKSDIPGLKPDQMTVDLKLPVKHVLSRELQLYFEKITELIVTGADDVLLKDVFASLATDSGLHPLVPYFTQFIADEVTRGLNDLPLLFSLMRVARSLLLNPHIHIEPYLHQLMPSVVTCLVAKRLGGKNFVNHWELRDFTATLIAFICKRFGHAYYNLQTRVTKTLLHAFLDPKRAMTQHYGAVKGIAALGSKLVRLLILPNLEVYINLLLPEMSSQDQANELKRYEAIRVYGALQAAAGNCIYEMLQSAPPSKKKPANNKSQSTTRKDVDGDASMHEEDGADDKDEGVKRRRRALSEAWKEDVEVGDLINSLVDLFGEGMLPFIPMREMSKCIL
ncbi:hypothetical protein SELMODRAFT_234732 [Selaginella moellendorffii]|uniref:TATA box binding protein associated factor (TAF) histone-like fold domain-containing protein n=1 Tax=Selaginella moellendorffii TaxID=88036 RepID=D8SPH3_SELML|nr:transcription initiation factor TFIID subunit 6 [Selaginella moellendorffii]EFJ13670.1 hypothetical protein SELMODRAFT_234732 [Selaginella moellendorffii]|eukprot:XP_002985176.1 transcription initiation factor TFIID subunit 6 [Selaginella moellendorffii]